MRVLKYLVVVVVIFVGLLFLLMSGAKGPEGISERQARAIAEAIVPQIPGSHSGLVLEPETNLTMTVHVDVSASMGGYVSANTVFLKMLDYLGRQWSARMRAVSTGYPPGKDLIEDRRFFAQQSNYFGGHDMAATIQGFVREKDRMHLLVTDGQPWDSGNNPAYERIASAINDFLTQGGRCVLLVYRSAYRGFYPSPLLAEQSRKHVFYECKNRPFAVWIFGHRGSAVNRVLADLDQQAGDLRPEARIQFGDADIELSLADRTLLAASGGRGLGREIGTVESVRTGNEVGRMRDYQLIRLRKKAFDDHGYVPMQFDLKPARGEWAPKIWENLEKGLKVELDCWEVPEMSAIDAGLADPENRGAKSAGDRLANSNRSGVASPSSVTNSPPSFSKLLHHDLEYSLLLSTNAAVTNASGTVSAERVTGRLVVAVPRPTQKSKRYAWLISLRSKYTESSPLLPRGFSTQDDRDPSQCDRILKLDEMLNIVAGRTERLGCLLYLADYPE